MSENRTKFETYLNSELRSIGYSSIPTFTKNAMYYEIDKEEARDILHSRYTGVSTQKDQDRYFDYCWDKFDGVVKTISEYKEDGKKSFADFVREERKTEKKVSEAQASIEREAAFAKKLSELKHSIDIKEWLKANRKSYEKTSSFMLNLFSEDDIVWASHDPIADDLSVEMKDMLSWAKKNEKLSKYRFFSINPYKDGSARKKSEIKKFKYMLLEADSMSKEDQFLMWIDLIQHGLPVKMMVHTGNKSLHCLVEVPDEIKTTEQYGEYVKDVFRLLNGLKPDVVDEACKNPDRLSRIPFGIRNDEKTDFEDVEQRLVYLQEDESKLQKDAREVLEDWCSNICKTESASSGDDRGIADEVEEGELLAALKDRSKVLDIWDDGGKIHTLMKNPHFGQDGKLTFELEDKKWDSASSFYSFMANLLSEQYGFKVDAKEVRAMPVRFKTAEKFPYVGERMPVRKNIVNTFIPGWLHKALTDDRIPSKLNEPLEQMLDNIFGNCRIERKWVLQWMREFMHTFSALTSPVFWEIPGAGKTMLAEAFGDAIGDWINIPLKKDDMQFNAWQDHTVIICEESTSGSKREGKELGDQFKQMITGIYVTIEAKGKDPVKRMVKNCLIFNANISEQIPPVFVEDNDRRYTIIRNDDAKNLIDIWSREDFDRWDSGEYKMQLMKWIYNLPRDESVNIRKGLDNVWKQEVVKMSKNNVEVALTEIVETYDGFISNADLIEKIKREYGISTTARANGNILRKLGYESIVRTSALDGSRRGYYFHGSAEVAATEKSAESEKKLTDKLFDSDN